MVSACLYSHVALAQSKTITLDKKDITLNEFLLEIRKQTGYDFVFTSTKLDFNKKVSPDFTNADLNQVLGQYFNVSAGVIFKVKNQTIVLIDEEKAEQRVIQGTVINETSKRPISGATVSILEKKIKTTTDGQGNFTLKIPEYAKNLEIRSLGYDTKHIAISSETQYKIELKEETEDIEDVVVTGIFNRSKDSFTGSSSTYTMKELKMVGNQNILQSLKTLDPSFAIMDNNEFGSDPNRTPDINIRGKTSVIGLSQEYENDPNQPLFILDGYETTLNVINDLNIDRVESITILKDAAATAIYGSKSANGVVVVETKKPEAGKFRVSYNFNSTLNWADLSDYNLMNSEEKLKFERLSGYYGAVDADGKIIVESAESDKYNLRLAESKRGVDTYWMNEPLRLAFVQSHNVYADGGDEKMRYGIGLTYGNTPGVMKGSDRESINGNIRLIYRHKNFSFANNLTVDFVDANREPINFSAYSSMNPYFRKFDENGDILKVLEAYTGGVWAGDNIGRIVRVFNPMYDASLNNLNHSPSFGFSNNFDADWRVTNSFRLRGRVSVNKSINKSEQFISPSSTQYENTSSLERGLYSYSNNDNFRYNGDLTATFGKLIAKDHLVNAVIGMRLDHSDQVAIGYNVRGFVDEAYPNPALSNGFATGAKPNYSETTRRSASYYSNFGYSYKNRYLWDGNFRSDGSSLFGVENKFTSTWAMGVAWNIHNEAFMQNNKFISLLKLRASLGNPGNQNFDSRMTMNIYSYLLTNQNPFGLAALVSTWGNQGLDWQKTIDKNFGLDIELFNRKLRFNVDYFNKVTDPVLVFVDVPSSVGTTTIPKNFGSQLTQGVTISANYQILKRESLLWNVNANARKLNITYNDFGNSLDRFNEENKSRSLQRYYDGGSPTDLWAVRSAGIDPSTGREIFIKKDGTQTFLHDYDDEVIVGNTNPKLEGIIGTSIFYKGFNFAMNFRYKIGGQIFQSALFNKVENISMLSLKNNQDIRALYDRWQRPGDIARYKSISLTDRTEMSDRFVVNENVFSAESISAGYDFTNSKQLKALGISGLNVRAYMNQIFRISSVKEERGTNFPFARSVSFSLGVRF